MTAGKVKYLSYKGFENVVSEFYGGDTDKTAMALKLAKKVIGGENLYIYRKPNKTAKDGDSPFCRLRDALDENEEGGLVDFLCRKCPGYRVKIPKGKKSVADIISLTPGDDLRVSNAFEKRLKEIIGDVDWPFAKEELLRLYPMLADDETGQLRNVAMNLVIVNAQIAQISKIMTQNHANGKIATKAEWDIVKDLRNSQGKYLQILGLTDDQLKKHKTDGAVGLAKSAEAMKERAQEGIATSDLMDEMKKLNGEKIEEDNNNIKGKKKGADDIDLRWLSEPAGETDGKTEARQAAQES